MRRLLAILIGSAALACGGGLAAESALAQGTGTSAGDQQYVDPLAPTTSTSSATAPAPPQGSSSSSAGSTTTSSSSAPPASSATSSTTPPSSPASQASNAQSSGATLPYTGLNLWVVVAVGAGLLGGGLLLRLAVRRA